MKTSAGILVFFAAAACSPSVPSQPTWVDDVRPILAATCIRCHSPPYIAGVPVSFRLDKYDNDVAPDLAIDDDDEPEPVDGARVLAQTIADSVSAERMPPRFPLTGRQIDVLTAWAQVDAPQGARENNNPPTMSVVGDIQASPGVAGLSYVIDDPDGDIVTGLILADPGGGADPIRATNELFVGRDWVNFHLPAGDYDLSAELDDGTETVSVDLGQVQVP